MLRSRIAALAVGVSAVCILPGCLEPLVDDDPGYSRYLIDAGTDISSVAVDPALTRKIDMNDGVSNFKATPKSGWAQGKQVSYWDLGTAKGSTTPAYQLAYCDAEGLPRADKPVQHPLLVDAMPGDADYSQLWAINYVCLTPGYQGELVTTMSALSDLYEMGLATEPAAPLAWKFGPIVQDGVVLEQIPASVTTETAYARGYAVSYVDFGANGNVVTTDGKRFNTANVYELTRPGSTKVEKVIFSSSAITAEGTKGEAYTPVWTLVTIVVTADADLSTFKQESDVVTVNADKTLTKAGPTVVSVTSTTTRVARPVNFPEEQQP